MMSTGSDSAGVTSKVLPLKDTSAHSSTAACSPVDIIEAVFICIYLAFELCSNSVTKATRWKPADDSRPITFIMVP